MAQNITWVRNTLIEQRGFKPLALEEIKPGQSVLYLDRNERGNYAPGWAVVVAITPGGKIKVDPYQSGKIKIVDSTRIMFAEWTLDMPRRKVNPCDCGHSNHEGQGECNHFECGCLGHHQSTTNAI